MKRKVAARAIEAIENGHYPVIRAATVGKRSGYLAVCTCGYRSRLRFTQGQAKAVFFWHLEQVIDESSRRASPELSEGPAITGPAQRASS